MQYRSFRYFVSWGKSPLGKTRRRGVCRLTYKGRVVERSSSFDNPAKRKQAGLKKRSAGQAIPCMVRRFNSHMAVRLGN